MVTGKLHKVEKFGDTLFWEFNSSNLKSNLFDYRVNLVAY